jgi:hypothetical protein
MNGLDQRTVAAISRGNRDAFVRLFDRTCDAVRAELASRLPDVGLSATVFASVYVEVWWLAGCHSGPELDVAEWIRNILDRRIADVAANARPRLCTPPVASGRATGLLPSPAELELAFLLGRPVTRLWPV